MTINDNTKKILKTAILVIAFFLISFFVSNIENTHARTSCFGNVNYADFDFDRFAEENRYHWTRHCIISEETDECVEQTLERQRIFYTRLYALLAHYQSQGFCISDSTIVMTVFFELTMDFFTDDAHFYQSVLGSGRAHNWEGREDGNWRLQPGFRIDQNDGYEHFNFWNDVEDNLQLLLRAMLGYPWVCYVAEDLPTMETRTNAQGEQFTVPVCPDGQAVRSVGPYCMRRYDDGSTGFEAGLLSRWVANGRFSFLGIRSEPHQNCREGRNNNQYDFIAQTTARVDEEFYWNFLENSQYFDRKPHLQHRFARVLAATEHENMIELHRYLDSLSEEEREAYARTEERIIEVRQRIISDIQHLLAVLESGNERVDYSTACNNTFWWPVGGPEDMIEPEDPNGVPVGSGFARGEPTSTTVTSPFGPRSDVTHSGVDIGHEGHGDNHHNIIAAKDGIIYQVVGGCHNAPGNCGVGQGELPECSCGGGWGNFVEILHADGTRTLYAHLAPGSITVSQGENVQQGQIIGRMGNTGNSGGVHLHFEVIVGGVRVDPMNYIDAINARGSSCCAMGGTSLESITPNSTVEERMDAIGTWLMSTPFERFGGQPMTSEQAMGFLSNLYHETRTFNPIIVQNNATTRAMACVTVEGGSNVGTNCSNQDILNWGGCGSGSDGRAIGMIQWDGVRRCNLARFAEAQGSQWNTFQTQIEFLRHEIDNTNELMVRRTFAGDIGDPGLTASDYAAIWGMNFFRSADSLRSLAEGRAVGNMVNRMNDANDMNHVCAI